MILKTLNYFWSNTRIDPRIELVTVSYFWSTFELIIGHIGIVSYP